jgi:4-amino-4-deoxy-L-arabinose transferase-like glycosyltransferase
MVSANLKKYIRPYLILFIVSLTLTLGFNIFTGQRDIYADEVDYHTLARHLHETGDYGWPGGRAARAPVYPYVLSKGVYAFMGENYNPLVFNNLARIMQSIFGALVIVLTCAFAHYHSNIKVGLLASFLLLLDYRWWHNSIVLMQENLFCLLVMSSFLMVLYSHQHLQKRKTLGFAIAGLLFGLSQLTKSMLMPLFPILCLAFLLKRCKGHKKYVFTFLLAGTMVILPWTYRNHKIFNHLVPVTTLSGASFFASNNARAATETFGLYIHIKEFPGNEFMSKEEMDLAHSRFILSHTYYTGLWPHIDWENLPVKKFTPNEGEWRRDKRYWQLGLDSVAAQPLSQYSYHLLKKVIHFWVPYPSTYRILSKTIFFFYLLSAAIGFFVVCCFFKGLKDTDPFSRVLIVTLFSSIMVTVLLLHGSARFCYPFCPILTSVAALTIFNFIEARKKVKEEITT